MNKIVAIYLVLSILISQGCGVNKMSISENNYQNQIEKLNQEIDSLNMVILKTQQNSNNQIYQPGSIYIQCPIEPTFIKRDSFATENIYTGNNITRAGVTKKKIIIKPAHTRWKKIESDSLCSSSQHSICNAWAYVEVPPVYKTIHIVNDTNAIKDFEIQSIPITILNTNEKLSGLRKLSCPYICYDFTIRKIQNALKLRDYNLENCIDNKFCEVTKKAIISFQQKNGIESGKLNNETIKLLEIDK